MAFGGIAGPEKDCESLLLLESCLKLFKCPKLARMALNQKFPSFLAFLSLTLLGVLSFVFPQKVAISTFMWNSTPVAAGTAGGGILTWSPFCEVQGWRQLPFTLQRWFPVMGLPSEE